MRRLLTVLLLALCAVGIGVGPAQAHNQLISSDPADGARLDAAPSRVTLEFDQPARQGYAEISVIGPGGGRFESGDASVRGAKVSMGLKELGAAGQYLVGYRVLSSDGHPITGKLTFTLTVAVATAPSDTPSTAPSDAPSDAPSAAPSDAPSAAQPVPSDGSARIPAGGEAEQAPAPLEQDLRAQAAEAAANGGAGMAILWVLGALVLLGAATIVSLKRSGAPSIPVATAVTTAVTTTMATPMTTPMATSAAIGAQGVEVAGESGDDAVGVQPGGSS